MLIAGQKIYKISKKRVFVSTLEPPKLMLNKIYDVTKH